MKTGPFDQRYHGRIYIMLGNSGGVLELPSKTGFFSMHTKTFFTVNENNRQPFKMVTIEEGLLWLYLKPVKIC